MTSSAVHKSKVVRMVPPRTSCSNCRLASLCLACGLNDNDLERLGSLVHQAQPQTRGQFLFHPGDAFRNIYVVKAGSFKTYTLGEDGSEQVTGFHLPGDIIGFDAIGSGSHPGAAQALETSSVCEISYPALERFCSSSPDLQNRIFRLMSQEILGDEHHLLLLSKKSAEGRLATLLLNISQRFQARGYSPNEFQLSMSRTDIGNYLGLAMETVSRLFTRLQETGLIKVERKQIRLVDLDGLKDLALGVEEAPLKRANL